MKLTPTRISDCNAKRRVQRAFTLVEALAALVFMAVLIPVTLQAVRVASRAGQVGERKATAARIAERVLNEWMITGGLQQASSTGQIDEGDRRYRWSVRTEAWPEDVMSVVTVTVTYTVQGQDFDVKLSSLFDPYQTTATTSATTTSSQTL